MWLWKQNWMFSGSFDDGTRLFWSQLINESSLKAWNLRVSWLFIKPSLSYLRFHTVFSNVSIQKLKPIPLPSYKSEFIKTGLGCKQYRKFAEIMYERNQSYWYVSHNLSYDYIWAVETGIIRRWQQKERDISFLPSNGHVKVCDMIMVVLS